MSRLTYWLNRMGMYTERQLHAVRRECDDIMAEVVAPRTSRDRYYTVERVGLYRYDVCLLHESDDHIRTTIVRVIIKSFHYTSDDEREYARICAEELLEKLREKP